MATDERFGLVPYAGYNPNNMTVYEIGIDAVSVGYKIASCIIYESQSVFPVYYCKIEQWCYYITESGGGMRIKATNSSSTELVTVTDTYAVTGTTLSINYGRTNVGRLQPSNYQNLTSFPDLQSAAIAFLALFPDEYVNISYAGNGCSIGGPSYVATGTGVVVPVTLPIGASLTADNISVTKGGSHIDFNYNPQTQQIAFTAI